ncbi:SusD/RagB family nutrient-binding outer membrane lipoprotein [Adhaeribacter swui]|uniref:SusD/RagB family nutrient-binding outer membrane lipoprotein n=1 Tax=Adhaeribacter swui TaxID=2086471 RepID=A0A7G7G949_9BACT|nr:SusD/RagB family nutrient-binding outer membrane lipoprotein [Adhaeribacter swui]QNF33683.1 SusD/RagB family nutrient-binding outer membrane lipoprotein [Adhaeribacter swui]
MKRKIYLFLFITVFSSTFYSCENYLDINYDPNAPKEVTEKLMLPAILSTFSYEVAGGFPVRISANWTKYIAYAGTGPHEGQYRLTPNETDNFWRYSSYTDIMKTSTELIAKANQNGNPAYSAIAKIMLAWNMSYVTDAFGDAPLSQAFQGEAGVNKPTYDKQEDIYKRIQVLLDEAITEAGQDTGLQPGAEDFIYGGDMTMWQKLARTLKARFYLRLSNAPGYNAATQADLALQALNAGALTSNNEMPKFNYVNAPNAENPWYQYTIDGKWSTAYKPSVFYLDLLNSKNDPRLEYQVDPVPAGANAGKYVGVTNDATPTALTNYSAIGKFYSAADAPLYMLVYAEVPFIRAEAEFLKAGNTVTPAVITAYNEGIAASMSMYGIGAASIATYQEANVLQPATAYEQIMTEKYIANYLQFESYNDFRRTGYPNLPLNTETYPDTELEVGPVIESIPVRFPYPSSERSYNPENIPAEVPAAFLQALQVPVWWDKQ